MWFGHHFSERYKGPERTTDMKAQKFISLEEHTSATMRTFLTSITLMSLMLLASAGPTPIIEGEIWIILYLEAGLMIAQVAVLVSGTNRWRPGNGSSLATPRTKAQMTYSSEGIY